MKNPLRLHDGPDGTILVDGLFQMADTHGCPLDVSIIQCEQYGWVPNWSHYVLSALAAGWPQKRIADRIIEGYVDSGHAIGDSDKARLRDKVARVVRAIIGDDVL